MSWEYFEVKFRNGAEYYFEVKVYERPSYWGINNGRVSKCLIHNRLREDTENPGYSKVVYEWDRGPWHPRTPPKRLIDAIMRRYPGTLPPYPSEPRRVGPPARGETSCSCAVDLIEVP